MEVDAGTGTADAGIGGVLTASVTTVGTTAVTTEETLWSYSLPANTLSSDTYGVRIYVWGSTAGNANNKTIRLKFGGTVVSVESSTSFNGVAWIAEARVFRTGASAQKAIGDFARGTTNPDRRVTTPAEATSGAITISLTGQNDVASINDIVLLGAYVEFLRAGS
jgi:VCBS repeat-containing protein